MSRPEPFVSRFLQSLSTDRELDCMALWKELRYVFFGRSLGRREDCDRLAEGEGPESPEWFYNLFSSWTRVAVRSKLTY